MLNWIKSELIWIFFHQYRRILKIICAASLLVIFMNLRISYMDTQKGETQDYITQEVDIPDSEQNERYNIKCSTSNCVNEKVIYLWTPIQDYFDNWRWGIGPHPVIKDCKNKDINYKCIITNHPDMIENADVVLFSIQDMEKVCPFLNF